MRVGLVAVSLLAAAAAVEVGVRLLGDYDRERFEGELRIFRQLQSVGQLDEEGEVSGTEGRILHPYYGWEILAERAGLQEDYDRALGELAAGDGSARAERFEVWILGGSVARYFVDPVSGNPTTGATHLAELLGAEAVLGVNGRDVVVKNHARIAMKQPQQLFLFEYLLALGLRPDLVVNLDGFNETAIAYENVVLGTHPTYPSADMWSMLSTDHAGDAGSLDRMLAMWTNRKRLAALADGALASPWMASAAYGSWLEGRMKGMQREYVELRAEYLEYSGSRPDNLAALGISFRGHEEAVPEMIERTWYESSVLLDAACDRIGVPYVQVLQPTLHDEGSKPLTPEEVATGAAPDSWVEGVRFGYPRLRAAGERLRAEGVRFVDASMAFRDVELKLYYDACHFNLAGNWVLAELVAAEARAALAEAGGD